MADLHFLAGPQDPQSRMDTAMHERNDRPRYRDEQGQALVEFALVLPVILLLLFGLIEVGRAYNYWVDQTHLANEAARFASVDHRPDSAQTITQYVRGQGTTPELRDGTNHVTSRLRVCINTSGVVGDPLTVRATSTFHWIPLLNDVTDIVSTNIVGTATMRVEKAPTNYTPGECAG